MVFHEHRMYFMHVFNQSKRMEESLGAKVAPTFLPSRSLLDDQNERNEKLNVAFN